ncbi:uncharacterized protein BDW70DRAFT_153321 [Aspergillus foveolatus]|uniref:uncharacterized protein n=1 Tax=Aspergillus foveolatus TaxID=210207 RepID=UPI003CCCC806
MSSLVATTTPAEEVGFSFKQGVNRSDYLDYRPAYPPSFFELIHSYHAGKPSPHGPGPITSAPAAVVIVSDPNGGYVTLARSLLKKDTASSRALLRFPQEGAEKSSVQTGTIDVAIAAECIQWTDTAVAIREIGRELKVGGTLAVTHYTVPRIVGNEKAQNVWKAIWEEYSKRATGPLLDHAVSIVNTALDCLKFPQHVWEQVKRIHVNAQGSIESYRLDPRSKESRVKESEEVLWVEGDDDWADEQDLKWFKGYLATWVPVVPENEIQHLWSDLERALGGGRCELKLL